MCNFTIILICNFLKFKGLNDKSNFFCGFFLGGGGGGRRGHCQLLFVFFPGFHTSPCIVCSSFRMIRTIKEDYP